MHDVTRWERLKDSRYPLREEPIDVPSLLQSVVMEAEGINRGQHRIATRIDPVWLLASRDEIRSAFSNLVTNAIRQTPPGGDILVTWGMEEGEPTMRVTSVQPEHQLAFSRTPVLRSAARLDYHRPCRTRSRRFPASLRRACVRRWPTRRSS